MKDCSVEGEEVCSVEHESECWTRNIRKEVRVPPMMMLIHNQFVTQVGDDVPECLPVVEQVKKVLCKTILILIFFI